MHLLEQIRKLSLNPKNAARLKELVLELAVRGKLTEDWRRENANVQPARILLERIREEKEKLIREKKIKKEKALPPISEEDIPYALPEGWEWCRLGHVFLRIIGGGTPSKSNPTYWNGDIPWASVKDLNEWLYLTKTVDKITEAGLHSSSTNLIPKGSIIICTRMGLGKIVINKIDVAINQDLKAIQLPAAIVPKFFFYLYKTLEIKGSGMTVSGIRQEELVQLLIPLPSLAEQKAIVEKVEQLMQQIEELEKETSYRLEVKQKLGAASLHQLTQAADETGFQQHYRFLKEQLPLLFDHSENIKKLRESILQLAVQGKLTASWRRQNPDIEPANVLLERIKEEKAKLIREKKIKKEKALPPIGEEDIPYVLPEGWEWCRLGDILNFFLGGNAYKSKSFLEESGNQVIRLGNVKNDRLALERNPVFIDDNYASKTEDYKLIEGDLLITMTGTREKKDYCFTVLLSESTIQDKNLYLNQRVGCLRFNKNVSLSFLSSVLKAKDVLDQLFSKATGTANQANIGKNAVIEALLPIPPLAEQQAIVEKVNQLMQLCDALEVQVGLARKKEESLMQALIHQTLKGKEEVPLMV